MSDDKAGAAALRGVTNAGNPKVLLSGRFASVRHIGAGRRKVVFKAIDTHRDEGADPVALIVPHRRWLTNTKIEESWRREVRKSLKIRHPNIASVYGFFRHNEMVFIASEYLEGSSLAEHLAASNNKVLSLGDALNLLQPAVEALSFLHDRGIMHCDVRPSNLFVCRDGTIKLLDSGIARARCTEPDVWSDVALKRFLEVRYASPEIMQGVAPDQRADVYSLACTIYVLLTGVLPYGDKLSNEVRDVRPKIKKPASLSNQHWKVLQQALSLERVSRTPSVMALVEALGARQRNWVVPAMLAAGLSLLVIAGGIFVMTGPHWKSDSVVATSTPEATKRDADATDSGTGTKLEKQRRTSDEASGDVLVTKPETEDPDGVQPASVTGAQFPVRD